MREILYRGKRKVNNEWVHGFPFVSRKGEYKIKWYDPEYGSAKTSEVYPETVSQFTGLLDKNGRKIFEGDIFQLEDDIVAVVIFNRGCFLLEEYGLRGAWTESGYDDCGGGYGVIECEPIDWYFLKDMEVIGNIHDNPELMEAVV